MTRKAPTMIVSALFFLITGLFALAKCDADGWAARWLIGGILLIVAAVWK